MGLKKSKMELVTEGGIFASFKRSKKEFPIINISLKGLKLITVDKFDEQNEISFNVVVPSLGTKPLSAEGKIVWVKPLNNFNAHLIGVEFVSMDSDSRKRLKNLILFLGKQKDHEKHLKSFGGKQIYAKEACPLCGIALKGQKDFSSYRMYHIG